MNTVFKYIDYVFQIAGSIVAPPLLGIFLGKYVDDLLNTAPVFLLILLFLGIATGIRSMIKMVSEISSKE